MGCCLLHRPSLSARRRGWLPSLPQTLAAWCCIGHFLQIRVRSQTGHMSRLQLEFSCQEPGVSRGAVEMLRYHTRHRAPAPRTQPLAQQQGLETWGYEGEGFRSQRGQGLPATLPHLRKSSAAGRQPPARLKLFLNSPSAGRADARGNRRQLPHVGSQCCSCAKSLLTSTLVNKEKPKLLLR